MIHIGPIYNGSGRRVSVTRILIRKLTYRDYGVGEVTGILRKVYGLYLLALFNRG